MQNIIGAVMLMTAMNSHAWQVKEQPVNPFVVIRQIEAFAELNYSEVIRHTKLAMPIKECADLVKLPNVNNMRLVITTKRISGQTLKCSVLMGKKEYLFETKKI